MEKGEGWEGCGWKEGLGWEGCGIVIHLLCLRSVHASKCFAKERDHF